MLETRIRLIIRANWELDYSGDGSMSNAESLNSMPSFEEIGDVYYCVNS